MEEKAEELEMEREYLELKLERKERRYWPN
jgi:hypothetical protein